MANTFSIEVFVKAVHVELGLAISRGMGLNKVTSADLVGLANRPPAVHEFPVKHTAKPAISGLLTTHAEGRYSGLRDG